MLNKNFAFMKTLLTNINFEDKNGNTALYYALKAGWKVNLSSPIIKEMVNIANIIKKQTLSDYIK